MMNRSLRRTTGLAALALTATLGLAACSDDGDSNDNTASDDSSMSTDMSDSPSDEMSPSDDMGSTDAAAQTFGAGCSAIPADGAGSFHGMATEPVATAASANPLLKTLVTAVGEAGLVDTLNSTEDITVFAPTDDAFAKIPAADLDALLADKDALTKVLTHHVVEGQLAPEDVAGEHETLAGDTITVEGSGEEFTVGEAAVICGNVDTANAKVYVVDSVLMP